MPGSAENRRQDLRLRAAGLLLLAIGAWALHALFRDAPMPRGQTVTPAHCALAAVSILALSLGAALCALGARLLDQVELSERWRRQTARGEASSPHALVGRADDEADPSAGHPSGSA